MNLRRATRLTAGLLALTGLVCVGVRGYVKSHTRPDSADTFWRVTYAAKFRAEHLGARLRVASPTDTTHAKLFHEDIRYSGLTATHLKSSRRPAREISLLAGKTGVHTVSARFDLHLSPSTDWRPRDMGAPKTPAERDEFLKLSPTLPLDSPEVREALGEMPPSTSDTVLQQIAAFCAKKLRPDEDGSNDALTTLRQKSGTSLGRARAMVTLLRATKTPARVVTGFRLERAGDLPVQYWVEALTKEGWIPFDPAGGFSRTLPVTLVPVRRDGKEIVNGTELSELDARFSVERLPPSPGATRFGRTNLASILDLTRLPQEMHQTLAIVLLMPLGALVTAIFRTVIGIRTFGTFTPTLLALSFVYADWMTGLLTFIIVLTFGLTSRTFLDRLKLLLVPRLGAMLTLVVLLIVFTVSVLDYFSLTPSAQAVILPMVILTMTVERFFLTSEEDSTLFALQLLGMTMLVGICCYLVLRWDSVGRLVLAYPELHFFTIAIMVLLGRFSGYRLTELIRFRDLVAQKK